MATPATHALRALGLSAILLPLVLAGLLLAPAGSGPASPPSAVRNVIVAAGTGGLSLSVTPGTWTMEPGGSVGISASLLGVPPLCDVTGPAVGWSLPGISPELAYLNASTGSSVEATSNGVAYGLFTVDAELTGTLSCLESSAPISLFSNATVTVLEGLALGATTATPDPALPGGPVEVGWSLTGGVAPYEVTVDFGDGTSQTLLQSTPGPGSVVHRFPVGVFAPQVSVTDALGRTLTTSEADPLIASYGLSAGILASTPTPEAGQPFWLNASVEGGVAPYEYSWTVDGVNLAGTPGDPASVRLDPTQSGELAAALVVQDSASGYSIADRRFSVASPPALSASPAVPLGEIGRPFPIDVDLTGGVAPYRLDWSFGPAGPSGTENRSANGTILLAPTLSSVGPLLLGLSVTDAENGSAVDTLSVGPLGLPPFVDLSPAPDDAEAGLPVPVGARIVDGVPPFQWSLQPSLDLANASPLQGTASAGANLSWSGTPTAGGNLTVRIFVLDALGGVAEANESLAIAPALSLRVTIPTTAPTAGATFPVSVDVTGGVAPYELLTTTGEGPPVVWNFSQAGPAQLLLEAPSEGYVTLALRLTDSGGAALNRTELLYANAAPVAPPPSNGAASPVAGGSPAGTLVGLGVLGAAGAVGLVLYLRRRPSPAAARGGPTERGRALEVVRKLLADGGGLDAESLVLIAEEEGLARESVEGAVARWERAGRVQRERLDDGEELLRWGAGPLPTEGPGPGAVAEAE